MKHTMKISLLLLPHHIEVRVGTQRLRMLRHTYPHGERFDAVVQALKIYATST